MLARRAATYICMVVVMLQQRGAEGFRSAGGVFLRRARGPECRVRAQRPRAGSTFHIPITSTHAEKGVPGGKDGAQGRVKCIFSDVDGTLLDKQHVLQPETQEAISDAIAAGIPFVMATGKSRGPWVQDVRRQLGFTGGGYSLNGPGVFIQGLLVCDKSGEPVQQLLLPAEVIREMNRFAAERGISLVAYTTDDQIVCSDTDEHTDKIIPFNEPVPEAIAAAGMSALAQPGEPGVYKLMLMGNEPLLAKTRPHLEAMLESKATVTKAMDEMLEILPLGASKWSGVAKALELVGFSPADCLVMGDGENDLEMLTQVHLTLTNARGVEPVAQRGPVPGSTVFSNMLSTPEYSLRMYCNPPYMEPYVYCDVLRFVSITLAL